MQAANRELERFSVAIPASVVSDTPHLREKTAKLGAIARGCSIFGVNEVIIYHDNPKENQDADAKFVAEILRYLETPQYLRKRLFKLSPDLRYTGVLPPLQTPPHNVPRERSAVRAADFREGVVLSRSGQRLIVDAGLEELIQVRGDRRAGERVTLRLVGVDGRLQAEVVDSKKSVAEGGMRQMYWGYRVEREPSLGRLLNGLWDLRIGTSRYGDPIQEVFPSISKALKTARSTVVAFGSPKKGLTEILAAENIRPEDAFHYFLNSVPDQQTVTVRTEEALFISLGIINLAVKLAE